MVSTMFLLVCVAGVAGQPHPQAWPSGWPAGQPAGPADGIQRGHSSCGCAPSSTSTGPACGAPPPAPTYTAALHTASKIHVESGVAYKVPSSDCPLEARLSRMERLDKLLATEERLDGMEERLERLTPNKTTMEFHTDKSMAMLAKLPVNRQAIPELTLKVKFVLVPHFRQHLKNQKLTYDQWVEPVLHYLRYSYRHSSLTTKIHIEVSKPWLVSWNFQLLDVSEWSLDKAIKWEKQDPDYGNTDAYVWMLPPHQGRVGEAFVGGIAGTSGMCFGRQSTVVHQLERPMKTAFSISHEIGHLLGMSHTFDEKHRGRDCHGIMDYPGLDPDPGSGEHDHIGVEVDQSWYQWSDCAVDDLHASYQAKNLVCLSGAESTCEDFVPGSSVIASVGMWIPNEDGCGFLNHPEIKPWMCTIKGAQRLCPRTCGLCG